jgi:hypothetical protein
MTPEQLYEKTLSLIDSPSVRAAIEGARAVAIDDCGRYLAKGGNTADPYRIAAYWVCLVIGL